jgi:hypothetical protein
MNGLGLRRGLVAVVACAAVAVPAVAWAQAKKADARPAIEVKLPETRLTKNAFSGSEFQVGAMNNVKADCSSGPVPDLRIVTRPENGEMRAEQVRLVVNRAADDPRANCNGKEVDAMGLFYKSRDGFVGQDKIVVDVDFKSGTVRRFLYVIAVR